MQVRAYYRKAVRSAAVCQSCGRTIHGGQPALTWLKNGRNYYACPSDIRPSCRPFADELEDEPAVAAELRAIREARGEYHVPYEQQRMTAAEAAAERKAQIERIRSRYTPEARASLTERKAHRHSRKERQS